ncbi:MAG: chitobiase/beta-hexosaminidase C-terminal domain-containing protein [Treponema sp.]|nr:chitobiase/beta-hexosaminidase C-terminal domain-containing protein [Treponema sp.]
MKSKWSLIFGITIIFTVLMIMACPIQPDSGSSGTQTVATPSALPAGGNYEATQTVTLTTTTSGATIYYTVNGSTPTTDSNEYYASIQITHTATLKAIAVKSGMNNSDVLSEHYIITPPGQVVQPMASPEGGNFTTTQNVTLISLTEGAAIYYTLDESEPTTASNEYGEPIEIKHTSTLKAIAVKSGMNNSDVLTEHYIITPPGQVVQPMASPEGGNYTTTQTVTLSTITQGAAIYYTLDESEPTILSEQYTSPITIEHTTTIKAIAVKTEMDDSDIMTEEYVITPPGQVVQPAANHHSGTYFGNQTITLSTPTEGTAIYYTLDESEPTTASTMYSVPISISETTVLKAYAVKEGMHESDVLTVNFTIIGFPLTDFDDIALLLDTHTGTIQHPIYLPVQIDLGTMTSAGSSWRQLLDIIEEADEFVDLDLSACTMNGTSFNPDANIETGKDKIVSIALPDTATSIADGPGWNGSKTVATFENFTALKSFSAEGLTSIGSDAFRDCTNLALTSLPEGLTSIGYYAFQDCTNLALTSLPEGLTYIGYGTFQNCTSLALTSLPEGLTFIGGNAFSGCTYLALTSLPTGITSIGIGAFDGCTNLALISLPSGITSISLITFQNCTNLALTSLPAGVTSIGASAFSYCTSLALISLPAGLTSIGNGAFSYCTNLALVTSLAVTPPTLGTEVFTYYGVPLPNLRIEVPAGSVEAYKAALNWSTYADRIFAIE